MSGHHQRIPWRLYVATTVCIVAGVVAGLVGPLLTARPMPSLFGVGAVTAWVVLWATGAVAGSTNEEYTHD